MAHVKSGHLIQSPEWAKHLRTWKKPFWGSHRQAERALCRVEVDDYEANEILDATE